MRLDWSTNTTLAVFGTQIFLSANQIEEWSGKLAGIIHQYIDFIDLDNIVISSKVVISLAIMALVGISTYFFVNTINLIFRSKNVFKLIKDDFSLISTIFDQKSKILKEKVSIFIDKKMVRNSQFEKERSTLERHICCQLERLLMEARSVISSRISDPGVRASILISKFENNQYKLKHFMFINEVGMSSNTSDDAQFSLGEGLAGLAWKHQLVQFGSPYLINFWKFRYKNPRYITLPHENDDLIRSLFCIPIKNKSNESLGVIVFDSVETNYLGSRAKRDKTYKDVIPHFAHTVGVYIKLLYTLRDDIKFAPIPKQEATSPLSVWARYLTQKGST